MPIRVCHLVLSLATGGLENGLVNLVNHFDEEQISSRILCIRKTGEMAERVRESVPVDCLDYPSGFHVAGIWKIRHYLKRHNIDILHTRNQAALLWGGLAKVFCPGIVHIHSEHGTPVDSHWLARWLIKRANVLMSVAPGLADEMKTFYKLPESQPVQVIMNGVDTNRFCPADKTLRSEVEEGEECESLIVGSESREGNRLCPGFSRNQSPCATAPGNSEPEGEERRSSVVSRESSDLGNEESAFTATTADRPETKNEEPQTTNGQRKTENLPMAGGGEFRLKSVHQHDPRPATCRAQPAGTTVAGYDPRSSAARRAPGSEPTINHSAPFSLRRELNLDEETFLFACVGRLDENKNQAFAIRAFLAMREVAPQGERQEEPCTAKGCGQEFRLKPVHQQCEGYDSPVALHAPRSALLIIGDGPERENLETLAEGGERKSEGGGQMSDDYRKDAKEGEKQGEEERESWVVGSRSSVVSRESSDLGNEEPAGRKTQRPKDPKTQRPEEERQRSEIRGQLETDVQHPINEEQRTKNKEQATPAGEESRLEPVHQHDPPPALCTPQEQPLRGTTHDSRSSAALRAPRSELATHDLRVFFLGYRKDVPALLPQIDGLLLPSKKEGMSNVILEANACGVPVLASDIPANRTLIEPGINGYLLPLKTPEAWRRRAEKIMADPALRASLFQQSRKLVEKKYSIPNMVTAYTNMYYQEKKAYST